MLRQFGISGYGRSGVISSRSDISLGLKESLIQRGIIVNRHLPAAR